MQGCYLYDLVYEEFDIETDTTLPFKIYVDDTVVYEFKTQEYWGTQTCGNSVDNIFLWKFTHCVKYPKTIDGTIHIFNQRFRLRP